MNQDILLELAPLSVNELVGFGQVRSYNTAAIVFDFDTVVGDLAFEQTFVGAPGCIDNRFDVVQFECIRVCCGIVIANKQARENFIDGIRPQRILRVVAAAC